MEHQKLWIRWRRITSGGLGGGGKHKGQWRAAWRNWERGAGMPSAATSTWDGVGQNGHAVGRAGGSGKRISDPNLRSKWVRTDSSRQRYLFGSHR
jgi:hypothetical protein